MEQGESDQLKIDLHRLFEMHHRIAHSEAIKRGLQARKERLKNQEK